MTAREWLLKNGVDLASDELYEDGGRLIWYSKTYEKKITEKLFRQILKDILWWEDEDIDSAVIEIKKLTAFI